MQHLGIKQVQTCGRELEAKWLWLVMLQVSTYNMPYWTFKFQNEMAKECTLKVLEECTKFIHILMFTFNNI